MAEWVNRILQKNVTLTTKYCWKRCKATSHEISQMKWNIFLTIKQYDWVINNYIVLDYIIYINISEKFKIQYFLTEINNEIKLNWTTWV